MDRHVYSGNKENRALVAFFVLVAAFSIPIWVLGPLAERHLAGALPTDLPISSLMTVTPILAAVVVVQRAGGSKAVKALLRRVLDAKRVKKASWYVPVFLLLPAMMLLQLAWAKLTGPASLAPSVPILPALASFPIFFIAAVGEEVGWHGYAIDRLQAKWNALTAAALLGAVWATWHLVPMMQMDRTPAWIAGQFANLFVSRIVYVWIYNATGKSVFATVLLHAMHNVTTVLLPAYGWPYDPFVATVILALVAGAATFLWGPNTMARFRYGRRSRGIEAVAG